VKSIDQELLGLNARIKTLEAKQPPPAPIKPKAKFYSQIESSVYTQVWKDGSYLEARKNCFNIKNGKAAAGELQRKNGFPIKFISWMEDATAETIKVPNANLIIEELRATTTGSQGFSRIKSWEVEGEMPDGLVQV
jgi:hypothetical protein